MVLEYWEHCLDLLGFALFVTFVEKFEYGENNIEQHQGNGAKLKIFDIVSIL